MAKPKFDFVIDSSVSVPRRIADFLNWAAMDMPLRIIHYNVLAAFVLQVPSVSENSGQYKSVQSAIKRAKKMLMDDYSRGIVSQPGTGIRATIDSDDLARHQFANDRKRVVNSVRSMDRTNSLINASDMKDQDLKKSVIRARGAMRLLVSNDVLTKLLPEAKKEPAGSN